MKFAKSIYTYLVILILFLVWMFFLDTHSWLIHNELNKEIKKLELQKDALEKIIPDIRSKVDHIEAATPRTIKYYTQHASGASFGTKFEGLDVSSSLPEHAPGLFHAGSVGIIMSGWLGTINYGVITP